MYFLGAVIAQPEITVLKTAPKQSNNYVQALVSLNPVIKSSSAYGYSVTSVWICKTMIWKV